MKEAPIDVEICLKLFVVETRRKKERTNERELVLHWEGEKQLSATMLIPAPDAQL